ncbi:MAG TPA: SMR family transporter [Candidatus Peribacteraceae bacterium]|nr:SMR family transporter [Candidatus Peribacteraceae bacterium]
MVYVFIALILLTETLAICFLKQYYLSHRLRFVALGCLFYLGVSLLLVQTFQYDGMGIVNVLWSAFSVILVVCAGHFGFHEKVTHREIVGIALVLIGVAFLPA